MEEQLAAGLGEGQVAELVEHDEVEPREVVGEAALSAGTGLGLELVDEVDHVEEPAARTAADAGAGDADGEMIAYRERKRIRTLYAAFSRRLTRRLARISGGTA